MIKRRAEKRAALQATRELSGELFHASNRRQLGHVLLQHFEILEQQRALVFQRWLKRFAAAHRVFDLPKDPGIGHGATADEHSITARAAKAIECLLNSCDVATAGHRNLN